MVTSQKDEFDYDDVESFFKIWGGDPPVGFYFKNICKYIRHIEAENSRLKTALDQDAELSARLYKRIDELQAALDRANAFIDPPSQREE